MASSEIYEDSILNYVSRHLTTRGNTIEIAVVDFKTTREIVISLQMKV